VANGFLPGTGLPALDRVLKGLMPGDNVVFQVESIIDYLHFVRPYCEETVRRGKRLIYFRFAEHLALVPEGAGVEIYTLDPHAGFELFITEIHRVIERVRDQGRYVFDGLSDLAVDWYSDRMLGNFFVLTCPFIYDVGAVAFFTLFRNYHSFHATRPIRETTQVLLDVYRHKGSLYIRPIKVQQRHSPTMYMLHVLENDSFTPVSASCTISEVQTTVSWNRLGAPSARLGVWNRPFLQAEEIREPLHRRECTLEGARELTRRLLRMVVSRDERVLRLAERHFDLGALLDIWKRMIGTGLIGGKAVGMLLARAILKHASPRFEELLEPHDSFYIGSDVFYTYLVQNGCWWVRQRQKDATKFLDGAEEARRRILMGRFPEDLCEDFAEMLDYFGQSPIIVRSSSLLEDAFGNSFAGKYESVFCANQGPHQQRLEDFMSAVRTIYASSMSEKALLYRAARGMLDKDEQMAILVQRVSGMLYGHHYFPQVAGVALSFNPYAWSEEIDPQAGVIRLVFGLGTRAVDRADDDYTRIIALNAPQRRPEGDPERIRHYAQRRVDTLDLQANQLVSSDFVDLAHQIPGLAIRLFASPDEYPASGRPGGERNEEWILTFDRLLSETPFVEDMREILRTLEQAYGCPVDTEFTANFFAPGHYRINLLQCRPLQVSVSGDVADVPDLIHPGDRVLEAHGAVIGQSRLTTVDRLIYVVPSAYAQLSMTDRYSVSRLIGELMHLEEPNPPETIMLLGPGRWGTSTPSLGVPVKFAEINKASILCELVLMREGLVPEVSLGTHFFNELVEAEMLYLALFPTRPGNFLNEDFLTSAPNRLGDLLPHAHAREHVVRVIDSRTLPASRRLRLFADTRTQKVVCFLDGGEGMGETPDSDYTTP